MRVQLKVKLHLSLSIKRIAGVGVKLHAFDTLTRGDILPAILIIASSHTHFTLTFLSSLYKYFIFCC